MTACATVADLLAITDNHERSTSNNSHLRDMEIMRFIASYRSANGYSPSQIEIARFMGYRGVRAAQYRLDRLAECGFINKATGVARGLSLTETGNERLLEYLGASK